MGASRRRRLRGVLVLGGVLCSGCGFPDQKAQPQVAEKLFREGFYRESAEAYRRILKNNRKSVGAAMGLGLSEYALKNYAEASSSLQLWATLEPDNSEAHFYAGMNQIRLRGQLSDAVEQLAAAISSSKNNTKKRRGELHCGLALAYCLQGRVQECLATRETARNMGVDCWGVESCATEDRLALREAFDAYISRREPAVDFHLGRDGGRAPGALAVAGPSPASSGASGPWADSTALVCESTRNLVTNPSFELGTSGWIPNRTVIAGSQEVAKTGRASLKVVAESNEGFPRVSFDATTATFGSAKYVFSVWVYPLKEADSIALFLSDNVSPRGTPAGQYFVVAGNRWTRLQISGVFGAGSTLRHLSASSVTRSPFYLDGAQLEQGLAATPYCDGSQPGCSWEGHADDSPSYRSQKVSLSLEKGTTTLPHTILVLYSLEDWPTSKSAICSVADATGNGVAIVANLGESGNPWRMRVAGGQSGVRFVEFPRPSLNGSAGCHLVGYSFDRAGAIMTFADSESKSGTVAGWPFEGGADPTLWIGSDGRNGIPFGGLIARVLLFDQVLPPSQVLELFELSRATGSVEMTE
jgi:hypothetical protein